MHYQFPVITTIEDVLPHIDTNFIVKDKEGITYINYINNLPSVFPPVESEDDIGAKIRRECRGIAFDTKTGKIVSRPFHKFFNMGERPDAQFVDGPHIIMEKLDGSMIRPVLHDGKLRLATKMGVTEVAMLAEEYLASLIDNGYQSLMLDMIGVGWTPIFEFTAPNNRIILEYHEPKLTLLALRCNFTGCYEQHSSLVYYSAAYDVPAVSSTSLEGVKDSTDSEGVVIQYHNGHMLKVKSDWYVKAHRAKDLLSSRRRFLEAVVEDVFDDAVAAMLPEDQKKAQEMHKQFDDAVYDFNNKFTYYYELARDKFETKRDYAVISAKADPIFRNLTFQLWDGKFESPSQAIWEMIRRHTTTNQKVDELYEILGL
jgi:RNA ligase